MVTETGHEIERLFEEAEVGIVIDHHERTGVLEHNGEGSCPSQVIEAMIGGYPVQPSRRLAVTGKAGEVAVDFEENLLGQIFRSFTVFSISITNSVD